MEILPFHQEKNVKLFIIVKITIWIFYFFWK